MFIARRATRVEQLRRSDMSLWSVQQHEVCGAKSLIHAAPTELTEVSLRSLLQTWRSYESLILQTRPQMRVRCRGGVCTLPFRRKDVE